MTNDQIKSGGGFQAGDRVKHLSYGWIGTVSGEPSDDGTVWCDFDEEGQYGAYHANLKLLSRTPSHGRVREIDIGELAAAIRVNLYRHAPNMPNYRVGIVEEVLRRALSTPPETVAAPIPVEGEVTDRQAAEDAFDAVLGDAAGYAEWGSPSYKENAIRTLTEHIAAHRRAFSGGVDDKVREALRNVPIPSKFEPMSAFYRRMDEWLKGPYREAMATIKEPRA